MDAHVVNLAGTLLAHVFRLFVIGQRQGFCWSVLEELWDKKWNGMFYYFLTSFHFLHRFPCQCYLSRAWYTIVMHSSPAKMFSAQHMVQWQFRAWPPATGGTSVNHRHWRRWWSVFYILHCDSL